MLTNYLKAQQFYRPVQTDTRSFNRGVRVSIALCCCLLIVIAIVVPLALIPLYIKSGDGTTTSSNTEGQDQQLYFRIPEINSTDNWFVKNGPLNSTALEQLKDILQSTIQSSPNEAISTSTITIKGANIYDSTDVNTRKRRQISVDIQLIDSTSQSQTKTKILKVTCALKFTDKYNYYTQTDYGSMLRQNVATVKLPEVLLSMIAEPCSDTVGYFEPVTGHTCQTYIDYGFCNGTSVLAGSAINSQLAEQNCCSCGKQA